MITKKKKKPNNRNKTTKIINLKNKDNNRNLRLNKESLA